MTRSSMRSRLRPGQNPDATAERLASLVIRGRNVHSAGPDDEAHRRAYLLWVNEAERELQDVFEDPATWTELHGEFFWRIRELRPDSPRGAELINGEIDRQVRRLEGLRASAAALGAFIARAPGRIAILDTHVLLHFEPPQQIKWVPIVGSELVRLVLPLRVVEELDEKKYTARDDLAQRARSLLAELRTRLAASHDGVIELREAVSLEVFADEEPRRRTLDADQEVLDLARELAGLGTDVVLVTDDAGLEIRARAQRVPVRRMDAKYLRRRPSSP